MTEAELRQIRRSLYRNRRRAAISAVLFFLFGAMSQLGGDVLDLRRVLLVGAVLSAIMTIGLTLLTLVFPKWRAIMEISAACAIVLNIWHRLTSDLDLSLDPWATVFLTWGFCMMLGSLYAGPTLDKWLAKVPITSRGRARTPLDIHRVWIGLYGLPEDRAYRYDHDDMIVYEAVEGDPGVYRVVERADGLLQVEEHQRITLRDAPYNLRFDWWVPSADDHIAFSRGTHTASLRETPSGGTEIDVTYQTHRATRRLALFAWIDDHFGRATDEKLARLEALCRDTGPVAVPAE